MRPMLVAILLSLVTLAGCLSDPGSGGNGETPGPDPSPGYHLDCSISNWDEPCLALASPNDSPSKTEIDLVVNPLDPMNVVVASKDMDPLASNGCVWAVAQVTKDGGKTWTTSYVGGKISDRQPGDMLYNFACITDPIMTFNKDGDLFYNIQAYRQEGEPPNPLGLPGPDVALMAMAISHDGGSTWSEYIAEQVGDDLTVFPDYMHMGTNPVTGTVFAIWNNIGGLVSSNPTLARLGSGDSATTLYPFITPSEPTGLGESAVVGANDGTVYVCLCGFNSGGQAYLSVSGDDGMTFSTAVKIFDFTPMGRLGNVSFRDGTSVEMTVDNSGGPHDGCLYATWGGNEAGAAGGSEIYVRSSCDKGATWSEPVNVNGVQPGGQWMPRITVDGHGGVHIVYLSQAHDMGGDDHEPYSWIDAEWAASEDGGKTWNTTRLTTKSFDGDLGIHQNGGSFLGDYIGIGSAGSHVWMGFPTTFTGRAEIAVAHVVYAS